jgi:chemotaxis protein MotB
MLAAWKAPIQMAGKRDKKASSRGVVIIKHETVEGGGHHGGAWKVAYADFVTAMMAFFLLMWLLNATTEDQRKGLADYFSPNNLLSHASSGTGEPFGGHTAFDQGALVSDRGSLQIAEGKRPTLRDSDENEVPVLARKQMPTGEKAAGDPSEGTGTPPGQEDVTLDPRPNDQPLPGQAFPGAPAADGSRTPTEAEIRAEKDRQEKAAFQKAADEIRDAVRNDPELAALAKQLAIDLTPEGLRIQIMDEVKLPMFATGSAEPNERARDLLRKVAPFLQKLPEAISIAGYTDATPYAGPGKTNWELSSERANATRRLLTDGGLAETRIRTVTGHADRDPLLPGDPLAAANRRIAIVVLRDNPNATLGTPPAGATPSPTAAPPSVAPPAASSPPATPILWAPPAAAPPEPVR